MRYLLICLLFAASVAAGCRNGDQNGSTPAGALTDSTQFTTVQWLDSTKDLGNVQEGQKVEVAFRFRNIGDKPLVITRVQPSCGCTVADQSKEPVAPGADGMVKATFNSQGHPGTNHKTLTVFSNAKVPHMELHFVVEVAKTP